MESWRTWWSELTAAGRAQWSSIAAGDFLTTEQLRRLQYEGLVMAGQMTCVDGKPRVAVPVELRTMAGLHVAMGA
jgi:hypothetical protein